MARPSAGWATGFLLLLCARLTGAAGLEIVEGLPLAPAVIASPPVTADIPMVPQASQVRVPPQEEFREIAARPLFSRSRRPYVPRRLEAQPPESEAEGTPVHLVGVFLTGRRRAALLLPEDRGQASWVREGEELRGWKVQRVERDRVALRRRDRVEVLELHDDDGMDAIAHLPSKPARMRLKHAAPDGAQLGQAAKRQQ